MRPSAPVALLLLAACDDDGFLAGDWDAALACEDGVDLDAWPACADGGSALLALDDAATPSGAHLTRFPGVPRADGGYSGLSGPVHGAWSGGELVLTLVADPDDPTASDGDRALWRGRVLEVRGAPASVAWDATWTFVDGDDVGVRGTAVVTRLDD